MKPIHATLIAMAGLLTLLNGPLSAQDHASAPPSAPVPAPTPPTPPSTSEDDQDGPGERQDRESNRPDPRRASGPEHRRSRGPSESQEKPTAFIGVLTGDVPRELRSHFALPEGFGLLVEEVMPDTPAQSAGLKVDDVLVRLEDQKLVNMEQLQTLVRSKKKGDVVAFTVISAGQEKQVTVTIDERMMPQAREGERSFRPFGTPFFNSQRGGPESMNDMRESLERYQKQMRDYQERAREWGRSGGKDPKPTPPAWNGPGRRDNDRRDGGTSRDGDRSPRTQRGNERRPDHHEFREAAHVTRSDDSGIYSLRKEGNLNVFTAKPKDGPEQKWNVNNEEERRAVPDALKEKLRLLEEIRGNDRQPEGLPPLAPLPEGKAEDKGGL